MLGESRRNCVQEIRNHPHWACKTSTFVHQLPCLFVWGIPSETFISIALVPVCVPKKASGREEMPIPGLAYFLLLSPSCLTGLFLRKLSPSFIALWSLSLQKQQRAPLREFPAPGSWDGVSSSILVVGYMTALKHFSSCLENNSFIWGGGGGEGVLWKHHLSGCK